MRSLLCTTSLSSILILSAPAAAQTVVTVGDARTTAIATSSASNGAPADITIAAAGSIKPASGPVAVTLDSDNDVKNDGTIQITDRNDVVGIDVTAGGTGTITNNGKIILDETYEAKDDDNDGDLDGPFSQGSNKIGIRTSAPFTGSIVNAGEITVEGNDSAGIRLGGALNGSLTSSGAISVTGNNGVGIQAGDVTGNVAVRGTVSAVGANAVGVAIDGDVGGALTIQGTVGATGYRYVQRPADPSKLDADDLLQGGPAVRVSGNVAGGILLDRPPANADEDEDDEDGDGIPDAQEGTANLISYGAAPALQIGSATEDLTIGAVGTTGHGLVVRGSVQGAGVYDGVNAVGIAIGAQGGSVDMAGGITLDGAVSAAARADATALLLGSGTSAPTIVNSGNVSATGGAAADHLARAIVVDTGASVDRITNSGTISATTNSDGTAIAIHDVAGTVGLVENAGLIRATGATADSNRAIAIDLSANDGGTEIRQLVAGEGKAAPSIEGNVRFGGGNDVFDVRDGRVVGNVAFGGGDNRYALSGDAIQAGNIAFGAGSDRLELTGTSRMQGNVDFGGGADVLSLAAGTGFVGNLTNSAGVAASVAGTLDISSATTVSLASLDMASTGVIGVTIDGETNTATRYDIAGAANFADGATVSVRLNGIASSLGDYVIVDAGTLTGGDTLATADVALPFLFKSELASDATAGTVTLSVDRKTAGELGLNGSESAAYDAIFNVLDRDEQLTGLFLTIDDQDNLRNRFGAFLPEHAGGSFDSLTLAARNGARFLNDYAPEQAEADGWTVFGQQIAWGGSKDIGDTQAYDIGGWGAIGGAERALGGLGHLGLSLSYASGRNSNGDNDNETLISQYELGAHWRGRFGGFAAYARGAIAKVDFDGQRRLYADDFNRVAKASWGGTLMSAQAGLSYDLALGSRLRVRPQAGIEYFRLDEDGWSDTGGGEGFDLTVEERVSDEVAANALLALGYELGSLEPDGTWLRLELEGGRREIVGGQIGDTIAYFEGGDAFTLSPDARNSGWLGRLRLSGGVDQFMVVGEAGAEEQQHMTAFTARLGIRVGW